MQTDYKTIKKQFEKSFKDYDENAEIQAISAFRMLSALAIIKTDFDNILELGSGTGIATKEIVRHLVYKNFCANDLVDKSKYYVKKYEPNADFICGNAIKIRTSKKFDLVISNAMFQWFDNLDSAILQIKNLIKKDGIISFTTFSPQNYKEIKDITGLTLNYKSINDIENILTNRGFEILYKNEFEKTLYFENPLKLLLHMKKTGVNSLSEKHWTITEVKEFCDLYSKKYKKTQLTYAPIIIIAQKKF